MKHSTSFSWVCTSISLWSFQMGELDTHMGNNRHWPTFTSRTKTDSWWVTYRFMKGKYAKFQGNTEYVSRQFSSVQFSCSVVSDSLWRHESQHTRAPCPLPTPGVHPNPCPSSQWCHPTISSSVVPYSSCPQPSQNQGLFKWTSSSHQMAKLWSFSFNISSSSEHPGLTSFRMDWLDLLAVQGTLKSLLQHHSSKASFFLCSAFFLFFFSFFFIVQLSHPYMTTGKSLD